MNTTSLYKMQLEVTEDTPVTLRLAFRGSLDVETARELKDYCFWAEVVQRHSNIIFDLGGLYFLDSAGVMFLIGIAKLAEEYRRTFFLTDLQPLVEKLLRRTGVIKRFNLFEETPTKAIME